MKDRGVYTVSIQCINCGKIYPFDVHTLIDPAIDPNAEKKIYSGEYFETVCPKCHTVTPTLFGSIYHDGSKKLMIGLADTEKEYKHIKEALCERKADTPLDRAIVQWLDTCKVRIVRSEYELQEKVMMAHFGLDDRIMELARYEVFLNVCKMRDGVDKLLFNVRGNKYYFMICRGKDMHEMVELDAEMYDTVKEKYKDVLQNDDVYEINTEWAKAHYREDDDHD